MAYIEAYRDQFGVEPICQALRQAGVVISPSGYYAARARAPSARAVRDAALEKQILRVYKDSGDRKPARTPSPDSATCQAVTRHSP